MASGGSDQNVEHALSKLLQMGTVAEYESEFVILANQVTGISVNLLKSFYISGLKLELQQELFTSRLTTLREAFFLARIAETRFEDERSTIAITRPNELTANVHIQDLEQTTQGRGDEPNRILLVTTHHIIYLITMEVLNQIFSPNGYVKKVIIFHKSAYGQALIQFQSHQNAIVVRNSLQGSDNTKSPLFDDTFGNSGVDESETLGPETTVKEVVDNVNGSSNISLVGYDTRSEVVIGLSEEFQEGDMVDALSRVGTLTMIKSLKKPCLSGFHEAYKLHSPTNSTTTPPFTSTNELVHDCNPSTPKPTTTKPHYHRMPPLL
uniref:Polypyrimidine tract-binding protein homolog 3 n=1 Tax=Tanacetum cinerariifolium TaxID=118510 RepID=A0A6L2JE76_TANCI|nr:polypyrimidine tract-binding protein homolog 3 [Tanacetum cinerariifolium]